MDISLVTPQLLDLLSRISGQRLTHRELTPSVIFLANLVTVLLGVIFVDGTVTESEKQRLLKTLYLFSKPESNVRQLTHLMIKGTKDNHVYKNVNDVLVISTPLSESERLLLIAFGYEMSAKDDQIDPHEKQYLERISYYLGINSKHLAVLEAGFTHQCITDLTALDEVNFLLDPARFYELDLIFIKATTDILTALTPKPVTQISRNSIKYAYNDLKKFQTFQKKLACAYHHIYQIIIKCQEYGFLPNNLIDEISKTYQKLQSQQFRLAVIGEFSQGKSTLLNALLGEIIQPVREIPCSGAVTVLKHGTIKRVICRYKNGTEEDIPLNDYQMKASISEDAALGCLSDELANSEIKEIVFEHPDLELCSSGVEIIDSPGLNEHPERTVVTQQILKDTDAVIFLTNVSRSLTQTERELLRDLSIQLNGGRESEPANNLFVVGNFMDLVRTDKGREQVKQRIERFLQGDNPLITGQNRIHFISAQAALDAMLGGYENEYLISFQNFTKSIETFLTNERGILKIKSSVAELDNLIQKCSNGLEQAAKILDCQIILSDSEKQKIFEQIGEASGRDVKIRLVASQLVEKVIEQAAESWDEWRKNLGEIILDKSRKWSSEHSPVWSQDRLIQDYINQFFKDLSQEIDDWGNKKLKDIILRDNLKILDAHIQYELDTIQAEFRNIEQYVKANFSEQLQLTIDGITDDFMGLGGIGGGLGIGGVLAVVAVGLLAFTGIGFVGVIAVKLVATVASSFTLGMLNDQIKLKVIELGFQEFDESTDKVSEKLYEITNSVFDTKVESASRVIFQAILLYENLLKQHEKVHQETLEQRENQQKFIFQQYQELEQLKTSIKAFL